MAKAWTKTTTWQGCLCPGSRLAIVHVYWSSVVAQSTQTITPSDYGITNVKSIKVAQATEATDTGYVGQIRAPSLGVYPCVLMYTDSNAVADSVLIAVPDGVTIGDTIQSTIIIEGV
jgi:hypothetical protein